MGSVTVEGAAPEAEELSSGTDLREMFTAAMNWLERNADAINAINVFPVADGDTGTNMFLTLKAAVEAANETGSDAADVVAQAMAQGALMGARGNSGSILYRILEGIACGLSGKAQFDGLDLAVALEQAATSAQSAMSDPREGTILTVMRELAVAASKRAKGSRSVRHVLTAAVREAKESVDRTPNLLAVLREAGVVDAGGQGLAIMLEGSLSYVNGDPESLTPLAIFGPEESFVERLQQLHASGASSFGFCTELVVTAQQGTEIDQKAVLEQVLAFGDSVLVVGYGNRLRLHVHTLEPDAVIAYGRSLGKVDDKYIKVDDITAQVETTFQTRGAYESSLAPIGTVAVTPGPGFEDVFRRLGVTAIVPGGETMNPSVEQIVAAIEACRHPKGVILLTNNKNVIPASELAAEHSTKTVVVLPTTFAPQGVTAMLSLNPEADLEENASAMKEAYQGVVTIEVKPATRTATIGMIKVRAGQRVGFLNGKIVAAEDSAELAVLSCLPRVAVPEGGMVTIYYGTSTTEEAALALAAQIESKYAVETTVVDGGQSYDLIVSVE